MSRKRAFLLAALALWGPLLTAFALGPLTECSHCVATFLKLSPLVPGIVAAVLLPGTLALPSAAITTLALYAGLVAILRDLRGVASAILLALVAIAVGAEAVGFSYLLRIE